jgi:hypothetical protein
VKEYNPNIRYFAPSLHRVYVGRFVIEERRGFGDGQQIYAILLIITVKNGDYNIVMKEILVLLKYHVHKKNMINNKFSFLTNITLFFNN